MELTTNQIAFLIVIALMGEKLLGLGTRYFFKKLTRDDYITREDCKVCQLRVKDFITRDDCDQCGKTEESAINKLTHEMTAVRELLLMMAEKQGISPVELKGLIS